MKTIKNKEYLQIRVVGDKNGVPLKPYNYDFRELLNVLDVAKDILLSTDSDHTLVSYQMKSGSVIHKFKTELCAIAGISAIFATINKTNCLDNINTKMADAIEKIQKIAKNNNYMIEMSTSQIPALKLKITKDTTYTKISNIWVDSEFYFYGKIIDAGGKSHPNIHLDTDEHGIVRIGIPKDTLKELADNPLYKEVGIRASGKQNLKSFEIDPSSLKFINFEAYSAIYDDTYFNNKQNRPSGWDSIDDPIEWLRKYRGSDE